LISGPIADRPGSIGGITGAATAGEKASADKRSAGARNFGDSIDRLRSVVHLADLKPCSRRHRSTCALIFLLVGMGSVRHPDWIASVPGREFHLFPLFVV